MAESQRLLERRLRQEPRFAGVLQACSGNGRRRSRQDAGAGEPAPHLSRSIG